MHHIDELRDITMARDLAESIRKVADRPLRFMEVCGTHTMAIARYGIKSMLGDNVKLVSGPGCPVCVTPQSQIDRFMQLGRETGNILTTFGDMIRVPGTKTNLEVERAKGADVRIVYSPLDAVEIAATNPDKRVIFFGVGFETTTPAVALAILEARERSINNFYVLSAHKLVPPALTALLSDPEITLNGLICPGHVSTILGSDTYLPIASDYGIPCVVTGFEPLDILQAIRMLVVQAISGQPKVEIQYSRAVSKTGNPSAQKSVYKVFTPEDAQWRGLGIIPMSGLRIKEEYAQHDASQFLPEQTAAPEEPSVCMCGVILKGLKSPRDCPAFGKACTPEYPIGPCMVSSEGSCAAEYKYSSVETTALSAVGGKT